MYGVNLKYKKPFAFEEAMQIIKDGSGKHFDPLIVDAFVGAEEDIRSVEHEFSQLADESGFISKEKIRKKK